MSINFNQAVENDKRLPHQIDAWNFLQAAVHKEILDEFARRYRNETIEPTLEGLPEPGVYLIKEFEGCVLSAYYDPHTGGLPITIGWGYEFTWQLKEESLPLQSVTLAGLLGVDGELGLGTEYQGL